MTRRRPWAWAAGCLAVLLSAAGARAEGNFGVTENEAGGYGEWHESPVKKDSTAKARAKGKAKGKLGAEAKSGAKAGPEAAADSAQEPDSLDLGFEPDSAARKPSGPGKWKYWVAPKADNVHIENWKPEATKDFVPDSLAADSGMAGVEVPAAAAAVAQKETDTLPALMFLPLTAPQGQVPDQGVFEKAETAVRLGLAQALRFRVWTAEEAGRNYGAGTPLPRECFSAPCLEAAARKSRSALVVAAQLSARDSVTVLKLVLAEVPEGRIRRAVQVWGRPDRKDMIPFAREAALLLAMPDRDPADARSAGRIDGAFFASRSWRETPWLNPKDTVDHRHRWGWAGSGVLLAGVGLAFAQGHVLQEDGNHSLLGKETLSGAGAQSFLRGFFAAPTLGARYAAMGGAGIAQVDNGLALLMNPAGVAQSDRESVVAAKRSLPDGTPSFFLAYAGPLYPNWSQGLGVQFEGDRLANETTLHGALGYDLGALAKALEGIKAGAQTKIYLAQVGEAGTGEDRATGRSFGMGLDLGLQAKLNERITAALAVRDAAGFLRHDNTLTDQSYGEVLPPEYRLGAVYRATHSLLLLMDGQKGIWADQVDHLRLGGEDVLFDFLALRCGLHEIFGREAVRKLTLGFGLNTDALGENAFKVRVSINYAYEFGLGEDQPLGGGQQFSLEAGF